MLERWFSMGFYSAIMPNANMFCMSHYRILLRFPLFGESGQALCSSHWSLVLSIKGKYRKCSFFLCFCWFKSTKKPYANDAPARSEKPTQIQWTVALWARWPLGRGQVQGFAVVFSFIAGAARRSRLPAHPAQRWVEDFLPLFPKTFSFYKASSNPKTINN